MASTFGDINFRLSKEFPGVDADVRQGIVNDRYTQILKRLPWSRLDTEGVIQTVARVTDGGAGVTLSVANTGTALVASGNVFTAGMTGRQIHIDGRTEAYTLTYVSATNATIDRPYEGDTNATAGFTISQSIITLPTNCRLVRSLRNLSVPVRIEKRDRAIADQTDPARIATGPPVRWNQWQDGSSSPVPMQIELWPAPDLVYSILVSVTVEQGLLGAADTGVALVPFLQPGALMSGCRADLNMLPGVGSLATAEAHEALFEKRLNEMSNEEARLQGGAQMQMKSTYTKGRTRRWAQVYGNTREIL